MRAELEAERLEGDSAWQEGDDAQHNAFTAAGLHSNITGIDLPPGPDNETRLAEIKAADNPLLEAAKPLLLALAQMRQQKLTSREQIAALSELLRREVTTFYGLCHRANLPREHIVAASFSLCTALDEAANSTAWGGAHNGQVGAWADYLLASHFHQDIHGGKKLFLLIGRLSQSPSEHMHLLQLLYHILGLGFEGQFAGDPQGPRQLETIRHTLLTTLTTAKEPVERELSQHWQGAGSGQFRLLRTIPVWVTASVLGLVVLGLYGWYKYQLYSDAQDVQAKIVSISKIAPPPTPVAPPMRLKELLKTEIASGAVLVEEDPLHSAVTFKGDDMFVLGQSAINKKAEPLLLRVAAEIAKVKGAVQVIGHTDSQPIHTPQFPDNQVLSEERASTVADFLEKNGVATNRLEIIGKGDTEPVSTGTSPADMARNRRVQIIVKP